MGYELSLRRNANYRRGPYKRNNEPKQMTLNLQPVAEQYENDRKEYKIVKISRLIYSFKTIISICLFVMITLTILCLLFNVQALIYTNTAISLITSASLIGLLLQKNSVL